MIIRFQKIVLLFIVMDVLFSNLFGQETNQSRNTQADSEKAESSPVSQDEKMQWWREARFGMLICWGVYAVYENIYNGVDVNGKPVEYNKVSSGFPSEWIMQKVKIPRDIYREAAQEFDAQAYDPEKWVRIAKDAGMKYIIITAKHHDGFCLFDSKLTGWDAVDASAARRDLLKDLVKEAKLAGLKIGFYYSQNLDWMHEGGLGDIPELNGGTYSSEKVKKYVETLVIPQIQELTSNYDIDLFWFDIPGVSNGEKRLFQAIQNTLLHSKVGSKVIVNDRLGSGNENGIYYEFPGDFRTVEDDTPKIPYNGWSNITDWEACASLNNSWGYENTPEKDWKTPVYTISRLLELTSKGGNYLLSVGPDKQGVIPEQAVNTLAEVGEWMKVNGEAIYGTTKNELVNPFEYGYVTQKNNPDGSVHFYLHVSSGYWDESIIYLDGIVDVPGKASLLGTGEVIEVEKEGRSLKIHLPEDPADPYYSVIDLSFSKMPKQIPAGALRNDIIRLTPFQAVTTSIKKDYAPYAFKYWFDEGAHAEFSVYLEAGVYNPAIEYAAWDKGELIISIRDKKYALPYRKTNNPDYLNLSDYTADEYPELKINIPASGFYTITLSRKVTGFNIIDLRNVIFKRDSFSGINPIPEGRDIRFYPCPVRSELYIDVPEPQQVEIYDISGKICLSRFVESHSTIDVSSLNAGVYAVKGKGKSRLLIKRD